MLGLLATRSTYTRSSRLKNSPKKPNKNPAWYALMAVCVPPRARGGQVGTKKRAEWGAEFSSEIAQTGCCHFPSSEMAHTGPNDFIWLFWVFYVKKNFFLKFHHFSLIFHRFSCHLRHVVSDLSPIWWFWWVCICLCCMFWGTYMAQNCLVRARKKIFLNLCIKKKSGDLELLY